MVGKTPADLERDPALVTLLDVPGSKYGNFTPWHVWTFLTPDARRRYVVMAAAAEGVIPGNSAAEILLMSSTGKEMGRWRFSTGWRIDIVSAGFGRNDNLHVPVIAIHSKPFVTGRDVTLQLFALDDGRLLFVRCEDHEGKLVRNDYAAANHTLGGDLPVRSRSAWTALLASAKPTSQLAALVFLSGIHVAPGLDADPSSTERPADATMARALRAAAATKRRLAELRRSPLAWVREAADAVNVASTSP